MKNFLLIIVTAVLFLPSVYGQGLEYDSKINLGHGLHKVKSGDFYGIINDGGDVIVSVEFQDILFREGKALLIKDDVLEGIVDSLGKIKLFDAKYKVHPRFRYIYDGFIIVGHDGKWGYLTADGNPLRIKSKMKNIFSFGKKHPTMFDAAFPFVEGYAAVYVDKNGWKHIDKEGTERFVLENKKTRASFRSSVYKGECIIVTDEGIKQYQENDELQAVVKRVLSSSITDDNYILDSLSTRLIYKEGILTMDSLMRVSMYESESDSIVFIEKPRKTIVKKVAIPTDTLSIKKDLDVQLAYKNLQANERGRAHAEIKLLNTSNEKIEKLSVSLECAGAKREWEGTIDALSEYRLSFNIPARFSSAAITRKVLVVIRYKDESVEHILPITIKRYNPIRSR